MDLKRLRTYVAVAELGSVSKAAQRLRITQPALSRQLRGLQRDLGLKLFDHLGRNLVIAPDGEQLLEDCRSLLAHADAILERAKSIGGGNAGVLKVAAASVGIETAFVPILDRYAQSHPAVQVRLIEAMGSVIASMLVRGEIQIGMCLLRSIQADGRDFATLPLQQVELLAAYAPTSPLGSGKPVDIERIVKYPLLLLGTGFSVRKTFDAACRMAQLTPNVLLESDAPANLLALAEVGHGVAIISSLVQTARYRVRTARLDQGGTPLREPLVIVWDRRRTLPSYAQEFVAMLATRMRTFHSAAGSE